MCIHASQMYAQRYGTIPVVHATGGLKDSVVQYNPFANETNKGANVRLCVCERERERKRERVCVCACAYAVCVSLCVCVCVCLCAYMEALRTQWFNTILSPTKLTKVRTCL
jgi:hypothetical protein